MRLSSLRTIALIALLGLTTFVLVDLGLQAAAARPPEYPETPVAPEPEVPVGADSLARQLRPGDIVVGVPVAGAESLLGSVRAGDRLNVVASVQTPDGGPATAVVVSGATVLQPLAAAGPLLLEVSAPDGMELAHLVLGGTRLSFSLWSSGTPPPTPGPLDADAARARLGLPVATTAPTSAPTRAPSPTPAPLPTPAAARTYTVQEGDTLESIASRLGVDPGALWWSNRSFLQAGPLTPGMHLNVPTISGFLYQVDPGDTWDSIASTFGVPASLVEQLNEPGADPSAQPSAGTLIFIPRPAR